MQVTVRLYAVLRAREGSTHVQMELADPASVADLVAAYFSTRPDQVPLQPHIRIAVSGAILPRTADLAATPLHEGEEVALLPPASGGSSDWSAHRVTREIGGTSVQRLVAIVPAPLPATLASDLSALIASSRNGAVVTFTGITRETPGTPAPGEEDAARRHAGERVTALEYEAAAELAQAALEEVCDEQLRSAAGAVGGIALVHAIGMVPVGAPSLLLVVAAPHRAHAYAVSAAVIDALKRDVPIWKSEHFASGAVWSANPDALRES
jgi:molybdopterin synthase catalytic subunit